MEFIGIDISKGHFDAYSSTLGNRQFSNNSEGYSYFKKWISELQSHCVMEASGPYYLGLANYLHDAGIIVSIINPLVIRRFCQMNLRRAKTDRKDAQAIASFGSLTHPAAWKPALDELQHLRQLMSVLEQLTKQLTSTRNAQEALEHHPKIYKNAFQSLKQVEKVQKEQIKNLEQDLKEIMDKNFSDQMQLLKSIPGIGTKTATMLIVITEGFTKFAHPKQLIAYVGLSPKIYQSGKTINRKPRIAKMGMSEIRRLLFMCSFQAIKVNEGCKQLYKRLRESGKAAKVALIAVANKLLRQAYAIATKCDMYKPDGV